MMGEQMTFPDTIQEFLEQYKIVDTEQVYTNGVDLIPVFRVMQWYEAHPSEKSDQNENFLEFLWNVIQPNEMQQYLSMYEAQGVPSEPPKEE